MPVLAFFGALLMRRVVIWGVAAVAAALGIKTVVVELFSRWAWVLSGMFGAWLFFKFRSAG